MARTLKREKTKTVKGQALTDLLEEGRSLSKSETDKLISEGMRLHHEVKRKQDMLKQIKGKFLELAENQDEMEFANGDGRILISSKESWKECDPKELLKALKEEGRLRDFPEFLKVQVSAVEKELGASMLKRIGKRVYDQFASVRFFPAS